MRVETLAGNEPALALYRSEGFTVVETKAAWLVGNERFPATGPRLVRDADWAGS